MDDFGKPRFSRGTDYQWDLYFTGEKCLPWKWKSVFSVKEKIPECDEPDAYLFMGIARHAVRRHYKAEEIQNFCPQHVLDAVAEGDDHEPGDKRAWWYDTFQVDQQSEEQVASSDTPCSSIGLYNELKNLVSATTRYRALQRLR